MNLFYLDKSRLETWVAKAYPQVLQIVDGSNALMIGDNYAAVGNKHESKLVAFTFDGFEWQQTVLHDKPGDFFYAHGGNYILTHNNDTRPDEIAFHYLNESREWKQGAIPYSIRPDPDDNENHDDNRSFWHGGPAYAAVMIDEFAEMIFQWDENYVLERKDDVLGGWYDEAPVYTSNEIITLMINGLGSVPVAAFRYDGYRWHPSEQVNTYSPGIGNNTTIGSDFITFPRVPAGDSAQVRYFDPNILEWEFMHVYKTDPEINDGTHSGSNFVAFGDQIYYRNPNGRWDLIYTIPTYSGWDQAGFFSGGYNLITVKSGSNTYVNRIHNGEVQVHTLYQKSLFTGFNQVLNVNGNLINHNIVITFPSNVSSMENAQSLTLHKLVDDKLVGKPVLYPVTLVSVQDGFTRQPTTYAYKTDASALMMASGASGQFNEVKVIPGSEVATNTPHGRVDHYFFNGIARVNSGYSPSRERNGMLYDGYLTELKYATHAFDSQGQQVAKDSSRWEVHTPVIERATDQVTIGKGHLTRTIQSNQWQDGIQMATFYVYDSTSHGQLIQMSTSSGKGDTIQTTYRYPTNFTGTDNTFGSKLLRDRGIVSPALEQTVTLEGSILSKTETHYALQHGQPVPAKLVTYPTGGSKSITSLMNYDAYGNLVQSQIEGGVISSFLYGYDYTFPVVEAVGATYNQLVGQVSLSGIQNKDGSALRDDLNSVRTGLSGSLITTRTYDRLYGLTSQTDPRGRTSHTHYDEQGRLHYVRDDDGYVRQKLEYSPYQE